MTALRDVLMVTGLVWWACVVGLLLLIAAGLAYSKARDEDLSELVMGDLVVGRDEFGNEVCFPRTARRGFPYSEGRGHVRRKPRLVANLPDPGSPSPNGLPVAHMQPGSGSTPKVSRPPGH